MDRVSIEREEISKERGPEEVSVQDFKDLGLTIEARYPWMSLALEIISHYQVEKKLRSWVFMLCRKFGEKVAREKFEYAKSKAPGSLRYFLASFRQK